MIKKQRSLEAETVHTPAGTIVLESCTRDGLRTQRRAFPMHSMIQNYWRIMLSADLGLGAGAATPYGRPIRMSGASLNMIANPNSPHSFVTDVNVIPGIQVGRSDTPVVVNSHALGDRIVNGTSTNQLNYLETTATHTDLSVTAVRAIENLSGATIDIDEIGLFAMLTGQYSAGTTDPLMYARDVLPETFSLPDAEVATATMTIYASEGNRNMHRMFGPMASPPTSSSWQNTFYLRDETTNIEIAHRRSAFAPAGNDVGGILLGTGDTEVEFTDIDLANRCEQGSGTGQLLYGAMTSTVDPVIGSSEMTWQLQRTIMNDSGDDIEIREMGLFGYVFSRSFLLDRFILTTPITLSHGENRQVRWLFRYTLA